MIDLCGEWGFAHDDEDCGIDDGWPCRSDDVFRRKIRVPFPPESAASGIHDPSHHPIVWYRRTFAVERAGCNQRVILHFGAVDYAAACGSMANWSPRHEGGHTPFSADITNELVDGRTGRRRPRRGPTTRYGASRAASRTGAPTPHAIWYHRTTGIWQPVWLEVVPDHLSQRPLDARPHHARSAQVAHLNHGPAGGSRIRVR